jgi:carbamoyl-phosphate synthase large subunit
MTLLQNKRVFVSGGAGVIGLEMVPRLLALGATVMVGDIKAKPKDFSPKVIYRQGDLNQMTEAEFRSFAPDIFIHLAATFERSTESYEFWNENFQHNVQLSHHLMTLAKDTPSLYRVVFASSYLIYDPALYQFNEAREQPISLKESDPVLPRNLTGIAKFSHEIEFRFIDQYCAHRLSTVCARIFRGYGRNSRDVISRWVRSLLREEAISVFRPEGIFDYIYAADSAEGLIRLAAADHVKGIINLGTGRSRRVQDVVDVLSQHFPNMQAKITDSDIPFEASQADISRYKQLVGWEPVYDLPQAIAEIINYERARLHTDVGAIDSKIPLNVLVSSSAAKVPLVRAIQAAVRQIDPTGQVLAGDLNSQALTSQVADGFWAMPPIGDGSLEDIISGLHQRQIKVVLPTRDGELIFWSRHATRLRIEGIQVVVSDLEPLRRCLDKLEFSHFGTANGLPFILTSDRLDDIPGECLVVKERFGAGSRSIGLRLDRLSAKAHALTLETPIFQSYVEGSEISIDAWLDRCHLVKGLVLRRRDHVVNGESQVTTTFSDPSLEAQAISILQVLQLSGPVVMQAMVTLDGELNVIECNPRFGGASTTSIAVGLSSLHWSLLEAVGANLSEWPFHRMRGQLRQIRVPTDFYVHDPT